MDVESIFSQLLPEDRLCPAGAAGATTVVRCWDRAPLVALRDDDEASLEAALQGAHDICQKQQWLPKARRISILERAAELTRARAEAIAALIALEGGKPLRDARIEVTRAAEGLQLCAQSLASQAGEEVPMGSSRLSEGRIALTQRRPIGPVAAISAFNHPFNLPVHQVGPALAAGDPFILKPAGPTPLCSLALLTILREAGLPRAYGELLILPTNELSQALATDPRIAFLSFIGSARVGWMLRSLLAPGTRCALEHGGAAPVIVAADADLDLIVPRLTYGGFYHAGQVCVSVQRIFAEASIADALSEGLAAAAKALRVGDPSDPTTDVGPLIHPREVRRIHDWVDEARLGGARILCGGAPVSETAYAPTVLREPPESARVLTQEAFGPIVTISAVASIDEAIARANSLPFAFQAAICTRDIDAALRAYQGLEAAAVMVNDHTAFRVDDMPFAGLKQSGLGVGGIPHSLREMQREAMLVIRSPSLLG